MTVFVGKEAVDFTEKAVMSDNNIDFQFNLRDYAKGYKCILFFYPLDFTFVCPSEIIAFHNRVSAFAERNTKLVGISIDSHFTHLAWKNTPYNKGGIGNIQFPLVADLNKNVSKAYGVLNEEGVAMRGTFLIDENFVVKHMLVNDLPLGRNVDETIRMVDALAFHEEHGEVCPAGWARGDDAMSATSEGVSDYLTSNAERL